MELSLGWHWGWEPQGGSRDWGHATLTLRVQQTCQPQVLLSRAEGSLQIVVGIGLGEFAEVHEVGPGQGHRVGRRQAGSRASGQMGESRPCLSPTLGEGNDPAKEEAVCAGPCLCSIYCGCEVRAPYVRRQDAHGLLGCVLHSSM